MNANQRIKELVRQRDSARAWAVELEQRNERAAQLLEYRSGTLPRWVSARDALRGES